MPKSGHFLNFDAKSWAPLPGTRLHTDIPHHQAYNADWLSQPALGFNFTPKLLHVTFIWNFQNKLKDEIWTWPSYHCSFFP